MFNTICINMEAMRFLRVCRLLRWQQRTSGVFVAAVRLNIRYCEASGWSHKMGWKIMCKLRWMLLTLLLLSLLVFSTLDLVKGDAASLQLAGQGSVAQVAALRHEMGLDRPFITRYISWLMAAIHGDFGYSRVNGLAVSEIISEKGAASLLLGGFTLALMIPLTLFLGVWSGLCAGKCSDRLIGSCTLILLTVPAFVTGTLMVLVFSFVLHWFPALSLLPENVSVFQWVQAMVLPTLTLLSICLAQMVRVLRAGVISASGNEATQMARLNGIHEWRIILFWIIPVALINFLPLLARYIAALLSGALIAETLFAWPGLASALLDATQNRDTPVIMAIAMMVCLLTVSLNMLTDLAVNYLSMNRGKA
ncbi:TPA: ABC transporter permease [Salmonella enterica]|uniref:ABC transporter permease n=3 Tax=Salmonella enterica TaxID=28901 RepID=A0A750IQT1_SALER|nr:ABC transporter permease [Salmonella enterica subsp. enterica serovar Oranienburg]HAF6298294.1 ABC transporter permease [Salmonella enterica]EDV9209315.1 ABC transporter permease [Salmonella enterica subsp. enterica serovar Oranienburg]EED9396859.1 ABC transporter permease [Salmonella enterica subsp. enterica serovar Oranienburg]MIP07293.1 ABC transporter permease [Salmonella enterica subsp. enterica serovar Oranienburg]